MAKSKSKSSNKPKKSRYKVLRPVKVGEKSYAKGDGIYLTKKGYSFFKSQKIVE